jgi:sporulation protein YlmC with PRC-barrel domain
MKNTAVVLTFAFLSAAGISRASAVCNIDDAKLEQAILHKPEFRDPVNRQLVLDLRHLRDSAFILWSYGRYDDCERLLANIRELISVPSMANLGGNDEDEADQQVAALDPMLQRGGAVLGRRGEKGAKPLVSVDEITPGLRADEIIGTEVRSSDDKIVGEVRNIVLATKHHPAYVTVASGGFFTPGKDSIVVPMQSLKVSQERESFYLPIAEAKAKMVPLMPDQEYAWLSDEAWRARNDALFATP